MPSLADAAALQSVVADTATLGTRDVVQLFRQYSDNPDFAVILGAAFPEIVGQYAQAAALVTAQAYDEWAPELPYHAVPVVDLPAERIAKTIAWALYARGAGTPLDRIVGALVRMIFDGSRNTVLANLDFEYADYPDPGPEPEGTRWARYASANACGFCRVLATRKAVYRSAADALTVTGRSTNLELSDRRMIAAGTATVDERLAARRFYSRDSKWGRTGEAKVRRPRGSRALGSKYHDHCHCMVVAVRPGQYYNPPDYVQQWQKDYNAAHAEHGSNLAAIANAMDKAETGRRSARRAPNDPVRPPPPDTAPGSSGTVPPAKPPELPVPGADGEEPEGWSGHLKGYVHPHRAVIWTEAERVHRQAALGVVPAGEQLYQHEIETVERMQSLGQSLEWIRRETHSTNDAKWIDMGGIEIDLKSTKAKQSSIVARIVDCFQAAEKAADRGDAAAVKENFVIDVGQARLTPLLATQLSKFNVRREGHYPPRQIKMLWIMTRGELVEIPLLKAVVLILQGFPLAPALK